jgi:hypothetical protein
VTQLDLFGEVAAAEQKRHIADQQLRDALVCLRDVVPTALENIVELAYNAPVDTRSPCASGDWAYCVCRAGLRFENAREWWTGARERGETWGWDRTPAQLVTWRELIELVGDDPRRAEVAEWMNSLPMPRWQLLHRPFELYPNPDGWHPSYIRGDHAHEQWPARRRAWQLTLDVLNDAIEAVAS